MKEKIIDRIDIDIYLKTIHIFEHKFIYWYMFMSEIVSMYINTSTLPKPYS